MRRTIALALLLLAFAAGRGRVGADLPARSDRVVSYTIRARLHPALFPRDRALIASQAHLTAVDETTSVLARVTSLSGALGACLLFGFLDALAIRLQGAALPGDGAVPRCRRCRRCRTC